MLPESLNNPLGRKPLVLLAGSGTEKPGPSQGLMKRMRCGVPVGAYRVPANPTVRSSS